LSSGASSVAVIIVCYHSGTVLPTCMAALAAQSRAPDSIVLVDNSARGASDSTLNHIDLDGALPGASIRIIRNSENIGFCRANNAGYAIAAGHRYVLFLNPDAFLETDFIERAEQWMEDPAHQDVAVVTGSLLGFDIDRRAPTGTIDSTGIFQTWYGKWFDRDQGRPWTGELPSAEHEAVPAICGALMFCRTAALETVIPAGTRAVFDEEFFMYKEDIDLSVRLSRRGWRLSYRSGLTCFHCRGWRGRAAMTPAARWLSARNELRVCFRNGGKGLLYSVLKVLFVPFESALIDAAKRFRRSSAERTGGRPSRP